VEALGLVAAALQLPLEKRYSILLMLQDALQGIDFRLIYGLVRRRV
jgi:hypothetical protein